MAATPVVWVAGTLRQIDTSAWPAGSEPTVTVDLIAADLVATAGDPFPGDAIFSGSVSHQARVDGTVGPFAVAWAPDALYRVSGPFRDRFLDCTAHAAGSTVELASLPPSGD